MVSRLWEFCVCNKYQDVIIADCYTTFNAAMLSFQKQECSPHIQVIPVCKFAPNWWRQYWVNQAFKVPINFYSQK